MDANELYLKVANYCAYQERSIKEVCDKMHKWEVPTDLQPQFLDLLQEEGYLNQQRFSHSFTRGKSTIKKWGKNKIKMHLKLKGVNDETINQSLQTIDSDEYFEVAKRLALKKIHSLTRETDKNVMFQKVVRYLLSKGYEFDIAMRVLNYLKLNPDENL